jgi:hypothetical protein
MPIFSALHMQPFERPLIILAILLLTSGCGGHISHLSPDRHFEESDNDAIIVMRVKPRAWVTLARGNIDRYGWRETRVSNDTRFWPEGGLVVAKVTPTKRDEAYGVVSIMPEKLTDPADEPAFTFATAMWPRRSPTCDIAAMGVLFGAVGAAGAAAAAALPPLPFYLPTVNVDLPTFKARAGEVTYVGAIRVDASKNPESDDAPETIAITPIPSPDDAAGIARFMATHFPNVRGNVVVRPLRMMQRNEYTDCE